MILADIQVLLQQCRAGELLLPAANGGKPVTDRDRIRSADLARLLGSMEGQPWCEWGKTAQPITPHGVARILSQAHIRPAPLRFHTGDNNGPGPVMIDKGYLHAQFTEAFECYLPEQIGVSSRPGSEARRSAVGAEPRAGHTVPLHQDLKWVPDSACGASGMTVFFQ